MWASLKYTTQGNEAHAFSLSQRFSNTIYELVKPIVVKNSQDDIVELSVEHQWTEGLSSSS